MSLAYAAINYPIPYIRAFQLWTGLFPVFIQATWIALMSRSRKPPCRVNAKTVAHEEVRYAVLASIPTAEFYLTMTAAPPLRA
jgi:hypothetical protein